jgi:starch synthase
MSASSRFILMLSSEAVPFSKTGGLADVAGALPLALGRLGHRVLLVLPRYRGAPAGEEVDRFPVAVGGTVLEGAFFRSALAAGVEAVQVHCPTLYDRDGLYGEATVDYPDNALRFAFLPRAALEYVARHGERPDLVHAHDWQTGLAPVYLKTLYAGHAVLGGLPTVFTIHNLAYQGLFPPSALPAAGLPWGVFSVDGLEYWGKVSYLKGGISFSEIITTVSRRYAREIQTPEYGFGFDGVLRRRSRDVFGILNGIDVERWDPETDPVLPRPYGPGDLAGKAAAREAVLRAFGMPLDPARAERPVVGMISRLIEQKGFDLLEGVAADLVRLDATFLLLGSGEPRYERMWRDLAAAYPDRVGARIGFDERLAHLIEGGADIFLMPSRFEPCGLNQMYSLRYGTIPVVRATGGLDDSVEAWNPITGTGTGFKFQEYSGAGLLRALRTALAVWAKPDDWRRIQEAGMRLDVSWDASARQYVDVYDRAVARSGG